MGHNGEKNAASRLGKRILTISVAMLLFTAVLVCNLTHLQFFKYDYYKNRVYDQITTEAKLKAKRGTIYDANMNVLASDKTVFRIFASSAEIKKRERADGKSYAQTISRGLCDIIGVDYSTLYGKLKNTNTLDITLKKSVEEDVYLKVIEFISDNSLEDMLFTEAQSSRYYPEGTLAAHVLGFVGSDMQGLYGLEYYYEKELRGTDGYYLYGKDANGNELPTEYATYVEATDGYSIVTTIDSYIQRELEAQLETIRLNHSVTNRVTGIVMDTQTGAILAMATSSPFDPNSPYELDAVSALTLRNSGFAEGSEEYAKLKRELMERMWANKAVSETYEPGSTFKIVTVSAALDSGAAKVTDAFSCHGYLSVGGYNIRCHKKGGHGSGFSLAYGLQMSCNPTMMTIAERMGSETFYKYVKDFGYLEKTGIDLPSESETIFHSPQNIGVTELATASFGQRFKVSVIRQLTSVCAIANGGELVTPYVVEKIIDSEGNVIKEHETKIVRRVVGEEVANSVADILEKGVSGGGGAQNAGVPGYLIAAKTGTSQKFDVLDENGNSYLRIGSTVGFSLSDDGGVAVIIVVDEPQSEVKYGSVVAAPYVSAFFEKALPYLGYQSSIEPSYVHIDSYVGSAISDAKKALETLGVECEVIGNGDTVIAQTPERDDVDLTGGAKVILYTDEESMKYVIVPDVTGMEISEANLLLINSGLNIKLSGIKDLKSGARVVSQSITPGSVVSKESVVELEIVFYDHED